MQPDNHLVHAVHQPRPPNRQQDDGSSHQERASHNNHLPNYCISHCLLHTAFFTHTTQYNCIHVLSNPEYFVHVHPYIYPSTLHCSSSFTPPSKALTPPIGIVELQSRCPPPHRSAECQTPQPVYLLYKQRLCHSL